MVALNFNPADRIGDVRTFYVTPISKQVVDTSSTFQCMKRARRWLVWKSVPNENPEGKPRKMPFYTNGRPRGETDTPSDIATLDTYEAAVAFCEANKGYFLGFALGPDGKGGSWQGFDFDNRLDGMETAPGYVELSPSGGGFHSIGYGRSFPPRNKDGIEAYSGKRFFTVTGAGVNDGPLVDLQTTDLRQYLYASNENKSGNVLQQYIDAGEIPGGECDNVLTAFHGHAAMAVNRGWASETEALAFLGRVNSRLAANKDKDFAGKFRRMMEKEELAVTVDPEKYALLDDGGELRLFATKRDGKAPPPDYFDQRAYRVGRGASMAIEFVVENFITTGIYALYGPYNSGKTSTILAVLLHVSGCVNVPGLPECVRRPVILISEHPEQVDRLIEGYRQAGLLLASIEELDRWFKVVPSDRQSGSFWKQALADLVQGYDAANVGKLWWPMPLVVFDTAASNLAQTRVESNAEISDILAGIREGSRGVSLSISIWIILHTAKSLRNAPADDLTAIGGQDWGASTIGEVKFTVENDAYLMTLGKRRFEIVANDAGQTVDQFAVESKLLDPIAVTTPWAEYAPSLATQQQVRRVVTEFKSGAREDAKAEREERQKAGKLRKLLDESERLFVTALQEVRAAKKPGICFWAQGGNGTQPSSQARNNYAFFGLQQFCSAPKPSAEKTTRIREFLVKKFRGNKQGDLYFFNSDEV